MIDHFVPYLQRPIQVMGQNRATGRIPRRISWKSPLNPMKQTHETYHWCISGWWFQHLWKILVNWDDYSRYMEKNVPNHQPDIDVHLPVKTLVCLLFAVSPTPVRLSQRKSVLTIRAIQILRTLGPTYGRPLREANYSWNNATSATWAQDRIRMNKIDWTKNDDAQLGGGNITVDVGLYIVERTQDTNTIMGKASLSIWNDHSHSPHFFWYQLLAGFVNLPLTREHHPALFHNHIIHI